MLLQNVTQTYRATQQVSRLIAPRFHPLTRTLPSANINRCYLSTQPTPPATTASTSSSVQPIEQKTKTSQVASEECEIKPKTTHYRVTLFRSAIGLPKPKRDTLASLGLKKRMNTVYHRHSPDAAGLILNVKELLKVENVTEEEMKMAVNSSRRLVGDDRGYRRLYNVRDL
ncbi:uncharacterized protein MELLADRAFT_72318 [Melampsora larici-populina 98AG31]|uniref:Large ribosomal subunit protein uL30m n=1 Tax=Melampsora larici-populina (strain 98AG31 / pathotype 3-4-7) TaxID=747676 RepID=F4RSF0_MELLP|nr:uncharacterized protein MELLADRAFT_72318 [Melampsora larici-populina 98AG31]EGG04585.1 hypothetical protein MELLADRAFT_72318 [Melampsora larici-populina 98AG31]